MLCGMVGPSGLSVGCNEVGKDRGSTILSAQARPERYPTVPVEGGALGGRDARAPLQRGHPLRDGLERGPEVLADGRKFIFGTDPSAADLSAYHPIWFARQNGGSEVNELISFATVIDPWYARVAAIGHGKSSEMTPDQAIEVAKANAPSEPHEWSSEATNVGLRRGDWVSVTPDDYGNPVYGNILAWTPDEVVVRHEDPSAGKVNLRFPRVGFDAALAEKQAA